MTLASLVDALPPWTLVGGKGGVGKTTAAAAIAFECARAGHRTLLVSTDPAATLPEALGVAIGADPTPLPNESRVLAMQLDSTRERDRFLAQWRDALLTIVDRGTYLARDEIEGLVDAAFPGIDESMALLALAERAAEGWDKVVLDTAPTGHTLRLLELPRSLAALLSLLDAMQEKHRFMVRALTHRYRTDAADAFLETMRDRIERLRGLLGRDGQTGVLLVTRPEPVVAAETARYAEAIRGLGMRLIGIVVNAATPSEARTHRESLGASIEEATPVWVVPKLAKPPIGATGIRAWSDAVENLKINGGATSARRMRASPAASRSESPSPSPKRGQAARILPVADIPVRPLTIVGGKGGVGKTTTACALAIGEADAGRRVLVVSTDPAPSIGDALELQVGDAEVAVPGTRGLSARQMDATAAFESLRASYATQMDSLFDAVLGRGVDVAHDRQIARELLALAPPGIDELYAISLLGELLDAGYERLIVDPAPTGHLLRLLEMPQVALDWSHRLMRLMLRYKEVAGLGDTAEMVLGFAKRTRALAQLIVDRERAGVLAVALDEPLVRGETRRLIDAVRRHDVEVIGLIWNRCAPSHSPEPLPLPIPTPQFVASALEPPPRGVPALRDWLRTVRPLSP